MKGHSKSITTFRKIYIFFIFLLFAIFISCTLLIFSTIFYEWSQLWKITWFVSVYFSSIGLLLVWVIYDFFNLQILGKKENNYFNEIIKNKKFEEGIKYFGKKYKKGIFNERRQRFCEYYLGFLYFCTNNNDKSKSYFSKGIIDLTWKNNILFESLFFFWLISILEHHNEDAKKASEIYIKMKKTVYMKNYRNKKLIEDLELLFLGKLNEITFNSTLLENNKIRSFLKDN